MLLRADRHVWTGAELLAETSGNHSLASSPALEAPLCLPPPHTYTHTPSLTVSVRLEEACCYTITLANLASGRQAALYHPPPPLFPQETGPISGVPLHSPWLQHTSCSPSLSWCSEVSGNGMSDETGIPHLKVYFGFFCLSSEGIQSGPQRCESD